MIKTIGKQYYLEEVGKKRVLCGIIGHRWEMNMSSAGPGSFDKDDNWVPPEEQRSYHCKNPRCEYRQHTFENYPDLSDEEKIKKVYGLRGTTATIMHLLDAAE